MQLEMLKARYQEVSMSNPVMLANILVNIFCSQRIYQDTVKLQSFRIEQHCEIFSYKVLHLSNAVRY